MRGTVNITNTGKTESGATIDQTTEFTSVINNIFVYQVLVVSGGSGAGRFTIENVLLSSEL